MFIFKITSDNNIIHIFNSMLANHVINLTQRPKTYIVPFDVFKKVIRMINKSLIFEKLLSQNKSNALHYARSILKGRFELGEPVIASDAESSFCYAKDVLKIDLNWVSQQLIPFQ